MEESGVPVYDLEWMREAAEPIAVGFFDGRNYQEFLKMSDEDDVLWRFLCCIRDNYKGIKLYAHYAAKSDAKFILAKLQEKKQPVSLEAGLMRLIWLKPRIVFEDSYAVLPGSLRALSEAFDVSRKLEWKHDETQYPWVMQEHELDEFRTYLKRDCISLSEVMVKYCKTLIHHFGVTPSLTLALTAVKAFDKNFYPVSKIASNEEFEKQIRLATYGGRNEIYTRYGENLNFYDIRWNYPSCYDIPVPIGKLLWSIPSLDRGTIAYAEVSVPKDFYIGPLPVSYRGKLVFPVGEFSGWWDVVELRFAAELGCDISIIKQLEAEEEPILKDFAEFTYKLRQSTSGAESRLWKLFGLRLSGKFGQSRWRQRVVPTEKVKDFTGSYPIDGNEEYHEFTEYIKGRKAPYIKPAINVRIRAEARVRHAKLLLRALLQGQIYYCDTDSIVCNSEMPTGTDLGSLKLIDRAVRAYFIQCKLYGYVNQYGTLLQASAGFRDFKLTEEDFQNLLSGKESVEGFYLSLPSWRDILKEAEIRAVTRGRTVPKTMGVVNRRVTGMGTKPLRVSLKDFRV